MTRKDTILKLSADLANELGMPFNISTIQAYIKMAIVSELDRQNQKLDIFHRIDPGSGAILGEYWGMTEICDEMPERNMLTVKRKILEVIAGTRISAYGFFWKRA